MRWMVLPLACLLLSGCTAYGAFLTGAHQGFYEDRKDPADSPTCSLYGTCGGVQRCEVLGNCAD